MTPAAGNGKPAQMVETFENMNDAGETTRGDLFPNKSPNDIQISSGNVFVFIAKVRR